VVYVVHRFREYSRIGVLVLLLCWGVLFSYVASYTNPPFPLVVLLLVPFLAIGWTFSIISRETVWETDDSGLRRKFGSKITTAVEWKDVGRLIAKGRPGSPNVVLLVEGKDHLTRMRVLSGAGIDIQALQVLYQSASQFLRAYGVEGENTLGWPNVLPLVGTQPTRSAKPNWAVEVGIGEFVSGALTLITAGLQGELVTAGVGGAISLIGIAFVIGTRKRPSKSSKSAEHRPPFE
jgi:hypothetical protein